VFYTVYIHEVSEMSRLNLKLDCRFRSCHVPRKFRGNTLCLYLCRYSWSYLACPWFVLRSLGCDINICGCLEGRKQHIASVLQRKILNRHRGDLSMYRNTVKNRNLLLFRARWAVSKADSYYSGDW